MWVTDNAEVELLHGDRNKIAKEQKPYHQAKK